MLSTAVKERQSGTETIERPRRGRGRGVPHRLPDASTRLETPPIVTVFRLHDGGLHHAWCKQPLQFQGRRAGLELDFYCIRCLEHVTLPEQVLERVPVRYSLV